MIDDIDMEKEGDYEEMVKQMNEKPGPKSNCMKKLMKNTYQQRRTWIVEAAPTMDEVTDKFPYFKKSSWVLYLYCCIWKVLRYIFSWQMKRELLLITAFEKGNDFLCDWAVWRRKIIANGELENHRKKIQEILQEQGTSDGTSAKHHVSIVIIFPTNR